MPLGVLGTTVEARYDPFNAGVAYAFVDKQWHTCYSEFHASFSTYSERSVWLATERLKIQNRAAGKRLGITAERLALFMSEREQDEELARQIRHDAEAAPHRKKIRQPGATASPPGTSAPPTPLRPTPRLATTSGSAETAPTQSRRRPVRVLEDL